MAISSSLPCTKESCACLLLTTKELMSPCYLAVLLMILFVDLILSSSWVCTWG